MQPCSRKTETTTELEGVAVAAESHFKDLVDRSEANRRIAIRSKFGGRISAEQYGKMHRSKADALKRREKRICTGVGSRAFHRGGLDDPDGGVDLVDETHIPNMFAE